MKKFLLFLFPLVSLSLPFAFKNLFNADHREKETRVAYDALYFINSTRAFPNADIPADGYTLGYEFYKKHFLHQAVSRTRSTATWENIGPVNVGGRTISIAIDPVDTNIIWMGSASGGLWKSTTGGVGLNAWTYIPIGFPVLGVSSIAIDPTDHDIMYIGTGETYSDSASTNGLVIRVHRGTFGIGILKSTDGGNTWAPSLDWSYQQNRGVWEIIFNPMNTNILYAATTEGVYKSTNAGVSWNNVLQKKMVMDLEIDKVDTNIIYAGVGNLNSADKGLYKTVNGGATWNILTNGLPSNNHGGRITVTAYPADDNTLMAVVADSFSTVGVYRSDNQGSSWYVIDNWTDIVSYQGWYAKGLLMKADDPNMILCGGVYLFQSSGSTFFESSSYDYHADIHDIIANPLDPNKIYMITDGGLYRSENFGLSFYDCNNGYITTQAYIGSVSSTDSLVALLGLQDNNTLKYNGNSYWFGVYGGDGSFNAIDPADDYHQLASYQWLNIAYSYDQGFSFSEVYQTPASAYSNNNPAAFIAPIVMSPSNPMIVYAGDKGLIKSEDGGWSWNPIGPSPVDNGNCVLTIATSATNPDTLYYATAPYPSQPMHVFRSTDGGQTQTDITNTLPNRYPRDIAVNPSNSNELYIVFSGFGTGHIYKSTDAGETWIDVSSSLPDFPFHSITIDPLHTNRIYAGSDFNVFASATSGADWITLNDGMPDVAMTFDLVVSPSDLYWLIPYA